MNDKPLISDFINAFVNIKYKEQPKFFGDNLKTSINYSISMDQKAGGIVLFSIFLIMGVIEVSWMVFAYQKAEEAEDWPTVDGEIIDVFNTFTSSSKRDSDPAYIFTYRYEVDGQEYENDRYYAGSKKYHLGKLNLTDYEVGDAVPVYYNPENPQDSYLWVGGDFGYFLKPLGFVTICFLMSIILLVFILELD